MKQWDDFVKQQIAKVLSSNRILFLYVLQYYILLIRKVLEGFLCNKPKPSSLNESNVNNK